MQGNRDMKFAIGRESVRKPAVVLCLFWMVSSAFLIFDEQKAHAMEGSGTEAEPYIIMTPKDLSDIRNDMDAYYKLGADIDLAGYDYDGSGPDNGGWMPIGNGQLNAFNGTLDGNGFAILNLTIHRPGNSFVGLFGWVGPNGKLLNIRLLDADVSGNDNVGILAGTLVGTIENSYATGRVSANASNAGGLVGSGGVQSRVPSKVRNSFAVADVSGWNRVGGLMGSTQGLVENAFAAGFVRGNEEVGGLIGYNISDPESDDQGIIRNSYSASIVTGSGSVGGLNGRKAGGDVINSFWNTDTSGLTSSADGFGITTEQMRDADTFTAWDAAVWGFRDGKTFPYLRSFPMAIGVDPLDPTSYSLHPGQDALSVTGNVYHHLPGEPIAVKYAIRDDTDAILAETDFLTSDGDGDLPFKHKFSLAGFDNGDYTLSITATDTRHAVAGITLGFTVDQAAPAPPSVVFGTNGSEVWAQTASTTVTVIDTGGGVDASSLQYAWAADPVPPAPGPAWTSFASGEALPKSGVDGDWYLHIRAKDSNGSLANVVSNRFRLDNTPPEVHFAPNGNAAPSKTAESTITVTDAASGIDAASLQYVWTQSAVTPADGWTGFANGDTLELKSGDGNWYLHVRAQDAVGNLIEAASGAFVLDNTAPVIALNGSNPMTVEANSPFTDPGATAHDSQDGDLSSAIVVTGSVDTAVPGTYTLHYNVSDAAGNAAEEVTRTVRVVRQYASSPVSVPDRPFIDLNGDKFDPSAIDTAKPSVTLEVAPKDNTAYVSIPASVLSGIAEIGRASCRERV